MKKIIPVYKPVCWTPLKAVHEFKRLNDKYTSQKISYAGRLDPMAEGVLLFLIGEENKKRRTYEDLAKTYEAEIILGISTDTFDPLGLITKTSFGFDVSYEKIKDTAKLFIGKQTQIYPPYSSKTVDGKPLYWWARNNKLDEIELPTRSVEIFSIKTKGISEILINDVYKTAIYKIENIEGDFRQKEIEKDWDELLKKNKGKKVIKIDIEVECSSGTYVRRLVSDLGLRLGIPALALSIKRTQIGNYKYKDCVVLT